MLPRIYAYEEDMHRAISKAAARLAHRKYRIAVRESSPTIHQEPRRFSYRFLVDMGADEHLAVSTHQLAFRVWAIWFAVLSGNNAPVVPQHVVVLGELAPDDACPRCLHKGCDGATCPHDKVPLRFLSHLGAVTDHVEATVEELLGPTYYRSNLPQPATA